jgi:hypothetical protein
VLRQLAKDADQVIDFAMVPKTSIDLDMIVLFIAVDYYRSEWTDDDWRQRMFEDYYAIRMACDKYFLLTGRHTLDIDTFQRCSSRGHHRLWPLYFIKNCISILHEGQIYH